MPEAFKTQCTAMGMQIAEPPAGPDLPTLIKEAVEKIVEPDKPEPTLASKVKQAVGTLKQLSEKKASLQSEADAVKAQYTQLLLQGKIEVAQKELQNTTSLYNQRLEKEKQKKTDEMADDLSPEAILTAIASVGLHATSAQVNDFVSKLAESAAKRRKCG